MKLIKRTALQFCEDLWAWLAKHPEKRKEDYPEWEYNGGWVPEMMFDCPCCEYVIPVTGLVPWSSNPNNCTRCPLYEFWPDSNCCELGSPFRTWRDANLRSSFGRLIRVSCATLIASAAREERLRLERKAKLRKEREA